MRRKLAFSLLLSSLPVLAHHSISGAYYTEQETKIEGTLLEFKYRSPHAFVELSGKDPKTGEATHFTVEWVSVKRLESAKIAKDTLKPGDRLVIVGNPSRTTGDKTLHMVGAVRRGDGWKWGRPVE